MGFAVAVGLTRKGAPVILNGSTEVRVAEAVKRIHNELLEARDSGVAVNLSTA